MRALPLDCPPLGVIPIIFPPSTSGFAPGHSDTKCAFAAEAFISTIMWLRDSFVYVFYWSYRHDTKVTTGVAEDDSMIS